MSVAHTPRRLTITVPSSRSGQKVDTLLRKELHLSGTVIRRIKWLPDGILLDGDRVFTSARVSPGQVLSVLVGDNSVTSGIVPTPGVLDIVYEDEDLLTLNKPAGCSVHPGPGHYSDTLGNFLMYYYESAGILADFHPVHRLDKGTSGLLVVAKHPHAQEQLKNALHTPSFCRTYLAVCDGVPVPASGTVSAPIGPAAGSLVQQQVRPDGKPAVTHYRTLASFSGRSLMELTLETGRTHQIRVHMAYLGCPLTGDFLYGREDPLLIARPALHSFRLSFLHPITGEPLSFTAPPPEDFCALLPPDVLAAVKDSKSSPSALPRKT